MHVQVLIEALKGTGVRAVIVGGAGSLYADKDSKVKVMETKDFPELVIPTAKGQDRNLKELEESFNINWTFVSPSAIFDPDWEELVVTKSDLIIFW